jgi:ubiquinone/menaquinone biosynthesis C-methylase UbiE
VANQYEKPWDLILRILYLVYQPDMKVVELCCGTAPGARAAAFLGISSYSIDIRDNQTKAAAILLTQHFNKLTDERKKVQGPVRGKYTPVNIN